MAGHVEPGEPVTEAARREAREEVGLELGAGALRVVGVMHRRSAEERVDDTIPYVRAALANFRAGRWFEEFGGTRS